MLDERLVAIYAVDRGTKQELTLYLKLAHPFLFAY
jgi:hypothetical protein